MVLVNVESGYAMYRDAAQPDPPPGWTAFRYVPGASCHRRPGAPPSYVKGLGHTVAMDPGPRSRQPAISVIMPSLNAGRYIAAAVESVITQLGPDDELIVQDGGSTDDTQTVLHRYLTDPRVRLVSERDDSQSDALHRAVARVGGDYVCWLNADDVLEPDAFSEVRAGAQQGEATVIYGDWRVIDADGAIERTLLPGPLSTQRLFRRGCYVNNVAAYIRTADLRRVPVATDLHYAMDYDLLLRLSAQPGFRAVHIPRVLGSFRYHRESKSGRRTWPFIVEALTVRRRIRRATGYPLSSLIVPTLVTALREVSAPLRYTPWYRKFRGTEHTI